MCQGLRSCSAIFPGPLHAHIASFQANMQVPGKRPSLQVFPGPSAGTEETVTATSARISRFLQDRTNASQPHCDMHHSVPCNPAQRAIVWRLPWGLNQLRGEDGLPGIHREFPPRKKVEGLY
jgi:hypothetical protein